MAERPIALPPARLGAHHADISIHRSAVIDPETARVLGIALEMTCIGLRTGNCDVDVKEAIAAKIIELAKSGERNPDLLCEGALKEIRDSGSRRAS